MSLAYTVRKLDAGPVIACERVTIDDQIKVFMVFFPEILFLIGFVIIGRCLIKFFKSIVLDAAKTDFQCLLLLEKESRDYSIFQFSSNG